MFKKAEGAIPTDNANCSLNPSYVITLRDYTNINFIKSDLSSAFWSMKIPFNFLVDFPNLFGKSGSVTKQLLPRSNTHLKRLLLLWQSTIPFWLTIVFYLNCYLTTAGEQLFFFHLSLWSCYSRIYIHPLTLSYLVPKEIDFFLLILLMEPTDTIISL